MELKETEQVEERTKKEFDSMKEVVLRVLEESRRARNDDHYLVLRVLRDCGEDITVELSDDRPVIVWRISDLRRVASFETITRVRREVQNTLGLWPPTDLDVALKRRIREDAVRKFYGVDAVLTRGKVFKPAVPEGKVR